MWKCKCGEMNPDSSDFCQSCGDKKPVSVLDEEKRQKQQRQMEELSRERRMQEQYKNEIERLKSTGRDGYYEYKVLSLLDKGGLFKKDSGRVDIQSMTQTLNELGREGWQLVTAYSNELGKNALSGGAGGAMFGVNSTVDENILIFERFIKIK